MLVGRELLFDEYLWSMHSAPACSVQHKRKWSSKVTRGRAGDVGYWWVGEGEGGREGAQTPFLELVRARLHP